MLLMSVCLFLIAFLVPVLVVIEVVVGATGDTDDLVYCWCCGVKLPVLVVAGGGDADVHACPSHGFPHCYCYC